MRPSAFRAFSLPLLVTLAFTAAAAAAAAQETAESMPEPVPAEFNPSEIQTGENTYLVMFQGTEVGDLTITVTEEGGLVTSGVVVDIFVQGVSVYQTSESRFRTDLTMVSMNASMNMMGTATESAIAYENGRVTGYAQTPNQMGGIDTVQIDTTLAPGTIGTGALPSLILTLDLHEGAAYSVPAFEPTAGVVRDVVIRVTEAGQTTVADGTFDSWTVALEGTQGAMTYYVRQSDHKVLKMSPAGQPVEFVLAGPPPE